MSPTSLRDFHRRMTLTDRELAETFRPLAHKRIVITGKLADGLLRDDAYALLSSWGAVMDDVVVASTDVLLAVDPVRSTVKQLAARRFGVLVLDEPHFVEWLTEVLDAARADADKVAAMVPPPPTGFFPDAPEDFVDTIAPLSDMGS